MKTRNPFLFIVLASFLFFSASLDCWDEEEEDNKPYVRISIEPETGTTATEFKFAANIGPGNDDPFRWTIYDPNQNTISLGNDDDEQSFYRKFDMIGTYTVMACASACSEEKSFRVVEDVGEFPVAIMQVSSLEGTLSTIFEFDASQSHDGQTPAEDLLARWDWTSDDEWDVSYSKNKTVDHIFDSPGEYEVSLQVKDGDDNESDIVKETIKINDVTGAPEAAFAITPESGNTLTDFDFDASASFDHQTLTEELLVVWDFENDGIWDTDLSLNKEATHRYPEEGDYEIKLMVQDADELVDYEIKNLVVENCIEGGEPCPGIPEIMIDGEPYPTVQIGDQCWLGKNLNVGSRIDNSNDQTNNQKIEKYCYDDLESNCNIYGGFYQWDEMMQYSEEPGTQGICPDEWRLPTEADYDYLANTLGGYDIAGSKMKSCTDDWKYSGIVNSNESGFTGLPAGYSSYYHTFDLKTTTAKFWTSNYVVYGGRQRYLSWDSNELKGSGEGQWTFRKNAQSVRCIKIQ